MSEKGKLELSIKNLVKKLWFREREERKRTEKGKQNQLRNPIFSNGEAVEFVKANQILIIRLENVGHKLEQLKG